jgi:hypothetical protein
MTRSPFANTSSSVRVSGHGGPSTSDCSSRVVAKTSSVPPGATSAAMFRAATEWCSGGIDCTVRLSTTRSNMPCHSRGRTRTSARSQTPWSEIPAMRGTRRRLRIHTRPPAPRGHLPLGPAPQLTPRAVDEVRRSPRAASPHPPPRPRTSPRTCRMARSSRLETTDHVVSRHQSRPEVRHEGLLHESVSGLTYPIPPRAGDALPASQSGNGGSSPKMADPARFARADPAVFADVEGLPVDALSVPR